MSPRILTASGAAMLLLLAACSSSKPSGGGGSSRPASSGAPAGAVTISATGSTLTGPDGRTLYANTVDTAAKITCIDKCAKEWPPVAGTARPGAGVDASKLGTARRPDGTMQVTYDGHPLYEFSEDKAAGDKKGEGIADEGGSWHVATASGSPAGGSGSAPPSGGGSSAPSSPAPSGSSSGGY